MCRDLRLPRGEPMKSVRTACAVMLDLAPILPVYQDFYFGYLWMSEGVNATKNTLTIRIDGSGED
jgi:hypothetical protein